MAALWLASLALVPLSPRVAVPRPRIAPPRASERLEFDADVSKLLSLLINSVYTDQLQGLRELVSNAADAIERRRFLALTQSDVASTSGRLRVWRDADELVLEDSGAGMTRRELEKGLGRVGASGTGDFAAAASALADSVGSGDAKALAQTSSIGRFGVGFYAAFLLAQRVSVVSLSAGSPDAPALTWESDGVDGYSIREATPDEAEALRENGGGTRVTLALRPDAADLAAERPLAAALRRYTPLLPFPVELRSAKGDWERLNPESSFWEAADDDDSADDAAARLFGALYPKSGAPLSHARLAAEGTTLTYRGVLFLPPPGASAAALGGVALYSQGALVGGGEAAAEDPLRLPSFARSLAAGVVDVSAGLTLTLDRERSAPTAASQATLRALRTSVLRALPGLLAPLADDGSDAAQAIWLAHGRAVLAGALPPSADADASEARASAALRQLCLFRSVSGGDAAAPRTLGAHAAAAAAAGGRRSTLERSRGAAAAEESALCEFAEARATML